VALPGTTVALPGTTVALPGTTVALPALPAARLARSGRPASEPAAGLPRGLLGFRFFPRLVPPLRCAGFCAATGEGDVRRKLPIAGFFQVPFTGSATSVALEVMVPIPLGGVDGGLHGAARSVVHAGLEERLD
jgi:hypothetical protein